MLSVKYHLGCDPASGDDESDDLNVVLTESADQLRPSWLRPARGDALQDEDPRTVPAWRSNPRTTVVKWTPSSPPRNTGLHNNIALDVLILLYASYSSHNATRTVPHIHLELGGGGVHVRGDFDCVEEIRLLTR